MNCNCSVWHISVAVCTVLTSWWCTERPSETCRVFFKNKINWDIGASCFVYYRNKSYMRITLCSSGTEAEVVFPLSSTLTKAITSWRLSVFRPGNETWSGISLQNMPTMKFVHNFCFYVSVFREICSELEYFHNLGFHFPLPHFSIF